MNEFLRKIGVKTILWVLIPSLSVGFFLLCHAHFEGCPKSWHPNVEDCRGENVLKENKKLKVVNF